MEITKINSHLELISEIKNSPKSYLLLHKSGTDQSECAYNNLKNTDLLEGVNLFSADVVAVRDIHTKYNISSVPTLLEFDNGKFINSVKGCNTTDFYNSLFQNNLFVSEKSDDTKPQKRVIVYSTPSCSWCTRIKDYLKHNSIKYTNIDVSKDQKAAEAMVKKSGKQGVPQTEINGQIVVGFDKPKINKLLGI